MFPLYFFHRTHALSLCLSLSIAPSFPSVVRGFHGNHLLVWRLALSWCPTPFSTHSQHTQRYKEIITSLLEVFGKFRRAGQTSRHSDASCRRVRHEIWVLSLSLCLLPRFPGRSSFCQCIEQLMNQLDDLLLLLVRGAWVSGFTAMVFFWIQRWSNFSNKFSFGVLMVCYWIHWMIPLLSNFCLSLSVITSFSPR